MKNRFFSSLMRSAVVSTIVIVGLIGVTGCNQSKTKWAGTWELKDPGTEESIKVVLSEDGKLYLIPPESFQSFQPNKTAYELDLTRVSDDVTVPEEYQVTNLAEEMKKQAELAKLNEAKQYVAGIAGAQQAYHEENKKFAGTFEELQLPIQSETENFTYKIVSEDAQKSTLITASAKNAELKSYTGAVYVVKEGDKEITKVIVCEGNENSTTPPAKPTVEGAELKCVEGSTAIQ
jgi:type IV pilus assembly protein PilA